MGPGAAFLPFVRCVAVARHPTFRLPQPTHLFDTRLPASVEAYFSPRGRDLARRGRMHERNEKAMI